MAQHLVAIENRPLGPAPELGQHTEESLLDLGYMWGLLEALRIDGVIEACGS